MAEKSSWKDIAERIGDKQTLVGEGYDAQDMRRDAEALGGFLARKVARGFLVGKFMITLSGIEERCRAWEIARRRGAEGVGDYYDRLIFLEPRLIYY